MRCLRRGTLIAAGLLLLAGLATRVFADSSAKEAAKQAGQAVGSAGRAVGKAGAQAGRKVGKQAKRDAPPAWRSLRDKNHAFWLKRKAELKKAFGKPKGSSPKK